MSGNMKGIKIAFHLQRSDFMQVQSITNLTAVSLHASESSKANEGVSSFAKLMSAAMQSNPDYNVDYANAAILSKRSQDYAPNLAA